MNYTCHVTETAGIEAFWIPKELERYRGNKPFSQGSFPKIRIDPQSSELT